MTQNNIHPTAVISAAAELAENVQVGAYSVIEADVKIGAGTVIGSHVVIKGPTTIGCNNRIFQFNSIGEAPQDLKYQGEPTELIIGDNNTIREYCTLNRGTVLGGGKTTIGSNNLMMAYCHVAHDCHVGSDIVLANNSGLAGHVVVQDHARLGGYTLVHQFSTLGESCFTGMCSVINKDVAPYTLVAGNYARAMGINKIGLSRAGMPEATLRALALAFRYMLYSKKSLAERQKRTEALAAQHPEVKKFLDFINQSQRGVLRN